MKRLLAAWVVMLSLLAGCGGMRLVDSDVQAISTLPAGSTALAEARYRFERLPSQTTQAQFPRLQALAEAALARAGLVRDDSGAKYSVQIGARVESFLVDPWGYPWRDPWWPGSYGHAMIGSGAPMWGFGMRYPPSTAYKREVSLILRELRSGQVVYETHAVHDGPWHDTDPVLAAMFDAALKDFPHPPAGVRRVKVEIPR